jgi:hypothetical protein
MFLQIALAAEEYLAQGIIIIIIISIIQHYEELHNLYATTKVIRVII